MGLLGTDSTAGVTTLAGKLEILGQVHLGQGWSIEASGFGQPLLVLKC